jgi:general secretion pathway protein E
LRVDPDVILIGEIRDAETAQIAIQSALTGHLVLSSIHANDTIGVITRLLDLGIEPFLIASALVGVISQRMVRKICPSCAQKVEGSLVEQMAYAKNGGEVRSEFLYGSGCELCTSGYRGRIGIFEVLRISNEIRTIIVNQGSSLDLQAQALKDGMLPLMKAGMMKVKENITTPSEVLRNAYSI